MSELVQHVTEAAARTGGQLLFVFGAAFALAFVLHLVSRGIRRRASSRIGKVYYWLVAPGVVCHETGHALGCLLTGRRIVRFAPFRPSSDGTLGQVAYESPDGGLFGPIAGFVIATGPVWFGTAIIMLLARLVSGAGVLPDAAAYFPEGTPVVSWEYVSALFAAAWDMLGNAVAVWRGQSLWPALCGYAVFCIASEITLSGPDLKGMWKGAAAIAATLLLLNLVPQIGAWIDEGIVLAKPWLFLSQVMLAFVLLVDLAFFALVWLLTRLPAWRRG